MEKITEYLIRGAFATVGVLVLIFVMVAFIGEYVEYKQEMELLDAVDDSAPGEILDFMGIDYIEDKKDELKEDYYPRFLIY